MTLNFIGTEGVTDYDDEAYHNNNIDNNDDDEAASPSGKSLPLHYSTPTEHDNLFCKSLNNIIMPCPL